MFRRKAVTVLLAAALLSLAAAMVHAEVIIDRVAVYPAGNTADTTGYGRVDYNYQIGKYEVTNAQYCEFLNAAAKSDPYALYNTNMSSSAQGGITRSGSPGSYVYAVKSGYANKPVTYVCWYDTIRFANWLTNKPYGSDATESGSYAITGGGANSGTVTVPNAAQRAIWAAGGQRYYLLPSEDEWYKAAYYKGGGTSAGYWLYPTSTNSVPYSDDPAALDFPSNSANYYNDDGIANGYNNGYAVGPPYLTNVGAYSQSVSPYGTLDQAGNVWEWNEAFYGSSRGLRGGSRNDYTYHLAATYRWGQPPTNEWSSIGFRVSSVPEPASTTLVVLGALVGLMCWKRRR